MKRTATFLLAFLLLWMALLWPVQPAAALAADVSIIIDPTSSSVVLGEKLDLVVTVRNDSTEPTPAGVVHLDITNPDQSTSVDPEDWTPTLNQPIGAISPGQSITVDWNIQPISPGTFASYAVVIAPGAESLATSNVLEVQVADQRSLNPGGILPVAIAAPVIIGALLLVQVRFARKTRNQLA